MPVYTGRPYSALPGPSVIPDRVLQAMHRPSPDIYSGELVDMVPGIVKDLKEIAGTQQNLAIYIANGHGVWEASTDNLFNSGDRVLILANGIFGYGWAEIAERKGIDVQILDFGKQNAADPTKLTQALGADVDHQIKAVMVCQVDTSTSILNDIPALRAAIDAANHPALFVVDCIASLGCDRFEMDAWGVDVALACSQKGMMMPPGMAFVFFNEKAAAAREKCNQTSWYWDWKPRADPGLFYEYFGGTAPVQHLYGLREALDMMREEGRDNILNRHDILARAYWAAFEAWGTKGPLSLNLKDPAIRSRAVTTLHIGVPHGKQLRKWLKDNAGVTLGVGLGMDAEGDPGGRGFFRVGHMGHLNAHLVLGVIGAIQTGMVALDIPHGSGALEAAAVVIARANPPL